MAPSLATCFTLGKLLNLSESVSLVVKQNEATRLFQRLIETEHKSMPHIVPGTQQAHSRWEYYFYCYCYHHHHH